MISTPQNTLMKQLKSIDEERTKWRCSLIHTCFRHLMRELYGQDLKEFSELSDQRKMDLLDVVTAALRTPFLLSNSANGAERADFRDAFRHLLASVLEDIPLQQEYVLHDLFITICDLVNKIEIQTLNKVFNATPANPTQSD